MTRGTTPGTVEPFAERAVGVTRGVWRNGTGTQRCRPEAGVVRATTEEEVAEALARTAGRGIRVRAAGCGSSTSDAVLTDGLLIDLTAAHRVLHLDEERATVAVQAGIPLRRLAEYLWVRGWMLDSWCATDPGTVGGALSVGAFGAGPAAGTLARRVTALRVVDAVGAAHELGVTGQRGPWFDAARIGLGAFGILTAVTLRVQPAEVHVWRTEPVHDDPAAVLADTATGLPFEIRWADPMASPTLLRAEPASRALPLEPRWRTPTTDRTAPPGLTATWCVSHECVSETLEAVITRLRDTPLAAGVSLRAVTIEADDVPGSPAFGTRRVAIEIRGTHHGRLETLGRALRSVLGRFNADSTLFDLAAVHPLRAAREPLESMSRLQHELDPEGVFRTPFVRRQLGTPGHC